MDNSASVINTDLNWDGKTLPVFVTIKPPAGSLVECQHCESKIFSVLDDSIIITERHHGQWHKTIVSLRSIGFIRTA